MVMVYHKTPRMFHLQSLVHHISLHLLTKTNSMHWYRLSFRKSPRQCLNNIVLRIGHSALRPDKKMGIAVSRQEHCSVLFPNKMSWRLHVQVLKLRPVSELPFVFQPRRLVAKECIMQHEPSKGIHYAVRVLGEWRMVIYYPYNALRRSDELQMDCKPFAHCVTAFVLFSWASWLELPFAV